MARAIDVHTHFVPDTMPPGTARNPLWPSIEHRERDTAVVIVGGKVFRTIDSRSWDADRRLQDLFARDPGEMAKAFYYDTILYDRQALRFLADSVGADRVVVGSDYPFSIKQDRPAQFAEQSLGFSRATFAANAARFLNRTASAL